MPSHVVLVEDTKINVVAFRHLLLKMIPKDCIVLNNCINGMDAIRYITQNQKTIDLVILDGNLAPGLLENNPCNGPDVAAEILKLEKKIPIAVWTDDKKMRDRFTALFDEQKFTDYHVIGSKPCHKEDILGLMEFAKIAPQTPCELPEVSASIGPRLL